MINPQNNKILRSSWCNNNLHHQISCYSFLFAPLLFFFLHFLKKYKKLLTLIFEYFTKYHFKSWRGTKSYNISLIFSKLNVKMNTIVWIGLNDVMYIYFYFKFDYQRHKLVKTSFYKTPREYKKQPFFSSFKYPLTICIYYDLI